MEWQPIETFYNLSNVKRRKINAVFFIPELPSSNGHSSNHLGAAVSLTPCMGRREASGWFEIPLLSKPPVQS